MWIPEDYNRTEIRLEARFDGTVTYAASSSTETMLISGETPWLLYAFLLAVTLVVISWFVLKKGTKKKSLEDKKEKYPAGGQQESIPVSIAISFPLIEKPYPNVWGVNEDFQIICDNEGKHVTVDKIRLYANDDLIGEAPGASDKISITHRFREKGKYNMICELSGGELHEPAKVQKELTIVDYREEIVALYHSFLEHLKERGIQIVKDATPQEIQQLASQMKNNEGMVKNIVRCFEEAQYSIHPVNRKYYETAWYALYQIKGAGGK